MAHSALMLGEDKTLSWAEVPEASAPGPDEVRIRMSVVALNHLDLFAYRGMAFAKRQFPIVVGVEGGGHVIDVGSNVKDLSEGDRVVIFPGLTCGTCVPCRDGRDNLCIRPGGIMGFHHNGVASQTKTVPARLVIKVPDDVTLHHAATTPVTYATTLHMLETNARLMRNESVLIHAAGSGIGSTAIKFAKHIGATVFSTVGSDSKISRARQIGADYVINYERDRFDAVIRRLTEKQGVDVVFEHVGVKTWKSSMLSLALGGRLVTCGSTTGVKTDLDLLHLFNRQIKIFASFGGTIIDVKKGLDLIGGGMTPEIDSVVEPWRVQEQLMRMANREVFGKIIVDLEASE
jgi:alcohol dehydrogenase